MIEMTQHNLHTIKLQIGLEITLFSKFEPFNANALTTLFNSVILTNQIVK